MHNEFPKPHNEFQALSVPFSSEEYIKLEKDILENGIQLPIIVWKGYIVDGYKRLSIIQKHDLSIKTEELDLKTKREVVERRVEIEYSKKNLSNMVNSYIIGTIYNASLKTRGRRPKKGQFDPVGHSRQDTGGNGKRTAKIIAETYKVGDRTVTRAAAYAKAMNVLVENHGLEFKIKTLNREYKQYNMDAIKELATFDIKVQKSIINNLKENVKVSFQAARKEAILTDLEEKVNLDLEFEYNKLYNGSAPDILSKLPDNCIDMVCFDPPWGVDFKANAGRYIRYDDSNKSSLELIDATCAELTRVIKPNTHIYMFFGITLYDKMIQILNKHFKGLDPIPLIWQKNTQPLRDKTVMYGNTYEPIFFLNTGIRPLRNYSNDILKFDGVNFKSKIHENQKSIELLQFLIENSSFENEVICDPFAGSGSTCKAAKLSNRRYIGIEKNKRNYENALEYINQE